MATNVFFNNFENSQEQQLIEDLIVESIRIYGHDMYYCPRTIVAKDDIFGEDTVSTYDSAYFIDMFINSFESFEGDGQFLSKFNLEIRDQMRFTVAIKTFQDEIGVNENLDRPQEGDLIYSPMMKRIFVVMYANPRKIFYQMGALQIYELTCEVFEYSNERFNTGIPEIDNLEDKFSFDMAAFGLLTNNDYILTDETGFELIQGQFDFDTQNNDVMADNDEFEDEEEEDDIIDWSNADPFVEALT